MTQDDKQTKTKVAVNRHDVASPKRKRIRKKHLLLLALLPVVIVGLYGEFRIVGKAINAMNRQTVNDPYCQSLDFGGGDCMVNVHIHNDTNATYTIKQCSGSFTTPQCKAFADVTTLSPGASVKASGRAEKDPPQPWLVLDQHGKVAGCLDLQYTKEYVNKTVAAPLSKLISCKPYL